MLVKDQFKGNAAYNAVEMAAADRRFDYLLQRREKLAERISFGMIALNAGTLVAVVTAAGSSSGFAQHLSDRTVALVVTACCIGIVAAIVSIFCDSLNVTGMASTEYSRLAHLRQTHVILESELNQDTADKLGTQVEQLPQHVARDFAYSRAAIWLLNASGFCWLIGVWCVIEPLLGLAAPAC